MTFTLEKVTLWVTNSTNPNIVANNLNTTYYPGYTVNQTASWIGSAWLFNFTDGSDKATAPPPIVWVKLPPRVVFPVTPKVPPIVVLPAQPTEAAFIVKVPELVAFSVPPEHVKVTSGCVVKGNPLFLFKPYMYRLDTLSLLL